MKVAILGTGELGSALGGALARAGATVRYGSRDRARGVPHAEAIASADVVVLAVPYPDAFALVDSLAGHLAGRIVVDPMTPWDDAILPISGAEALADRLGPDTPVVAAWQTTFAAALARDTGDVLLAGDDTTAKTVVAQLVRSTGGRPLDCGALREARVIEGMCRLMMPILRALDAPPSAVPAWRFDARSCH